mmetsp:Transcript_9994/g.27176  ORF Transcript_9994/g.27176 Transcript_9994/m.27176 type:complete len:125 (-) Transcript_9994:1555-1929(-)
MASLLYNRRSESFLPTQQLVRTRPAVFGGDSDYVDSLVFCYLNRLGCAQLAVFAVALPVLTILTLAGGTNSARGGDGRSVFGRFVAPGSCRRWSLGLAYVPWPGPGPAGRLAAGAADMVAGSPA